MQRRWQRVLRYLVLNIWLTPCNLDTKIKAFHDCIQRLQKSRSLKFYSDVKESYDNIKVTVSGVFKLIEGLLLESKIDKLAKTVDEDLTIIHKKDEKFEEESKEETKGEPKEEIKEKQKEKKVFLKKPDIFNKEIRIVSADYLSNKKIKELDGNIEKVCKSLKLIYNLIFILEKWFSLIVIV